MDQKRKICEKTCKLCLHYSDCLKRFRAAKSDGQYEFMDEDEYFAHADDCNMYITEIDVARKIFAEIEDALAGCAGDNGEMILWVLAELKKKHIKE